MKEYEPLLRERNESVGGHAPWYWLKEDNGAWVGPVADWNNSHLDKYKKHVKKWDVCVQAGGNQGLYPRLFADHFNRVYTFEPDHLNFICLVNNCQVDNVMKIQAALGEKAGGICMSRNTMKNTGMHTVIPDSKYHIPLLTLDSLNLDACDLIQLDIEGYEIHAVRGAKKTIEKYKPVIACERGSQDVTEFLKKLGYAPVDQSVADTIYAPT